MEFPDIKTPDWKATHPGGEKWVRAGYIQREIWWGAGAEGRESGGKRGKRGKKVGARMGKERKRGETGRKGGVGESLGAAL